MGIMKQVIPLVLIAVGLIPTVIAANQSEPGHQLLDQLRNQRQMILKDSSRSPVSRPQTNLPSILGVSRHELLQSLGTPDYCGPPSDAGCSKSPHVAYFFYHHTPPSARAGSDGTVVLSIDIGGGWALETDLDQDAVENASWKNRNKYFR
jgi:hypothetical protein